MMKKRYLFLLLSVLCTGGMYAQDETQKPIDSYDALSTIVKKINDLPNLKVTLSEKQKAFDDLNNNPEPETLTETTDNETTTNFMAFFADYADEKRTTNHISYTYGTIGRVSGVVIVAVDDLKDDVKALFKESDIEWSTMYGDATEAKWKNNTPARYVRLYYLDYKKTDNQLTYKEFSNLTNIIGTQTITDLNNYELLNEVNTYLENNKLSPKTKDVDNPKYEEWFNNLQEAQSALTKAQGDVREAETVTTLTIETNIEVPSGASSLGTWPADHTINGNGHQIINNSTNPLFTTNYGDISNWISLDRSIASSNRGWVTDCIVIAFNNNGTQRGFRIYDDENKYTEFEVLEEAIYSVRNTYGMDLTAGKRTVGAVKDDTRLYQAKYANAKKTNASPIKVNIKSFNKDTKDNYDLFGYDPKYDIQFGEVSRTNAVVYLEDVDINDENKAGLYAIQAAKQFTNVAVKDGDSYVCENAKLTETDKDNKYGFYVPFAFTATNLTYDRNVTTQYVSVCLPFALTAEVLRLMGNAKAYTFDRVESSTKKMKFKPATSVGTNTPCILAFADASEKKPFETVKGVNVASTPTTLTSDDKFYGNYKAYQTAADLGADDDYFVYGVQKDKFVKMADNSHMNAFRGFVLLDVNLVQDSQDPDSGARAFTISLLDEDGNEEVTGIELVNMSNNDTASDFKAVGGRNAIEITTGKACDVKVYTLNGALAKTARVEAGTTTLPMNAGMYVVNKTKVIVK